MNLLFSLSGHPATEDELEQGIYNLLLELDVQQVDDKEDIN